MALMASTTRCAARWTGTESTASRRQLRQAHQCGAMSASGHVRSSRTSLSRLTARGSRSPPRRVMSTSVACTSNAVTRRPASAFTRSPPLPAYLFTQADSPGGSTDRTGVPRRSVGGCPRRPGAEPRSTAAGVRPGTAGARRTCRAPCAASGRSAARGRTFVYAILRRRTLSRSVFSVALGRRTSPNFTARSTSAS